QTGDLEIGPGVVTCTVRETNRRRRDPFSIFGMFDDREVTLRSRPLTVHVRPLPKPEPDDFTGGVGRFKMRTSLDRDEVAQGEPITLTVHIEGTGNVPSVGMPPLPDLEPQFRAFAPSAPAYEPTRDGDLMGGSSEFSVVLVPETTGRLAVPPIHVSTFRPSTGRYEQLTGDSLFVKVLPGAATAGGGVPGEVTRTGWDLRTIRTTTELQRAGADALWASSRFWIVQAVPLALLGAAWLLRRRRADQLRNWSQIQGRKAPGKLRKTLRELAAAAATIEIDEGYARLESALSEYLQSRLGFSLSGRRRDELRATLEARGVGAESIGRMVSVLERCDYARFAPGGDAHAAFASVIQDAESALAGIEQARPAPAPAGSKPARVLGALLLVAGLAGGVQGEPEITLLDAGQATETFQGANAAFERQDYRTAIDQYRRVLDAGYVSPDLLLNLGDAYYRSGKIGWAVYAFERGRRLAPHDPDLQANLELALRSTKDRTEEPDQSRFLSFLVKLQERFPLTVSMWIASGFWWLLLVWLALRLLLRAPRRMEAVTVLVAALFLGALSWTAVQAIQYRTRPNAVIVADELAVRSNPDPSATVEFTLHGGTLLRTARTAPGFREVRFSNELHGWADETGVAPL
ncbi:MAG: BatD family protein, partial [Candidatus Eisenbacteria bacterium]|nr:BatD family protein [Candidatus Eisenbacteria bacterium]